MKFLVVIQARMGSSRLGGKVLMEVGGKKVIDHVLDRVKQSKLIDEVVVATSISKNNLPLIAHISTRGDRVFVGSENDVLDRYYQISKLFEPQNIVRITADCPMIDPEVIDKTIQSFLNSGVEYCSNCMGLNVYPDGMDVEVFTRGALETAWKEATKPSEHEHVTPYIRDSGKFSMGAFEAPEDYSNIRVTLDEERDLKTLTAIFDKLNGKIDYRINDIIEILKKNPEIAAINGSIIRNEGYIKSLKND